MKALIAGPALAAALLATPLLAQPPGGPPPPMTRDRMLAQIDRQFQRMDADHDGVVTKAEFDAAMAAPPPPPPGGGPGGPGGPGGRGGGRGMGMGPMWFDAADANHDGKVTQAEAAAAAGAMFDRMDTNHDGTITPDERGAMGGRPPQG